MKEPVKTSGTDPAREVETRDRVIIRTSIIGIVANLFLAAFKAAVGLLSRSIAVVLDAVNNLSDALSSVITVVGTRLAGKKADKKHPLGHGRVEYISAMLVAALVLYAGVTAFVESVKKILAPEPADYTPVGLVIIGVAVLVKIFLGVYVKKTGQKVNSGALVASGSDAMGDAVLSASVLLSALVYLWTKISLEAYVGVVIAVFIIRAGLEMISDTVSEILGKRADPELSRSVKALLCEEPEVRGAYDLILNNYGPDRNYASVHLELPDTMTVEEVDLLTRRVQAKVYRETGVILTGVGVYSYNTTNSEAAEIRNTVQKTVLSHEWALQMHGFHADTAEKIMRFDVVVSFDEDPKTAHDTLLAELSPLYPDYTVQIVTDADISD